MLKLSRGCINQHYPSSRVLPDEANVTSAVVQLLRHQPASFFGPNGDDLSGGGRISRLLRPRLHVRFYLRDLLQQTVAMGAWIPRR
ncbi:MAG: hypothetical protein ACT4TC_05670 [Myxococcaceae bacterium]